jgi:hypothetical protein
MSSLIEFVNRSERIHSQEIQNEESPKIFEIGCGMMTLDHLRDSASDYETDWELARPSTQSYIQLPEPKGQNAVSKR